MKTNGVMIWIAERQPADDIVDALRTVVISAGTECLVLEPQQTGGDIPMTLVLDGAQLMDSAMDRMHDTYRKLKDIGLKSAAVLLGDDDLSERVRQAMIAFFGEHAPELLGPEISDVVLGRTKRVWLGNQGKDCELCGEPLEDGEDLYNVDLDGEIITVHQPCLGTAITGLLRSVRSPRSSG